MKQIAHSLQIVAIFLALFWAPSLLGGFAGLGLARLKPGGSTMLMFLMWVMGGGVACLYCWALLRKRDVCTAVEFYLISAYAGISCSLSAYLGYYLGLGWALVGGVFGSLAPFGLIFVLLSIPGWIEKSREARKWKAITTVFAELKPYHSFGEALQQTAANMGVSFPDHVGYGKFRVYRHSSDHTITVFPSVNQGYIVTIKDKDNCYQGQTASLTEATQLVSLWFVECCSIEIVQQHSPWMAREPYKRYSEKKPDSDHRTTALCVQCDQCEQRFDITVDLRNDLIAQYDDEGHVISYTYCRILHDESLSTTCLQAVEVTLTFDTKRKLVDHHITGGSLV